MRLLAFLIPLLMVSCAPQLVPVKKGKKYGYETTQGQPVIEPKYTSAKPFYEGLAKVGFNETFVDSFWNEPAFGNEGYWTISKFPVERFSYIDKNDSMLPLALHEGRNFSQQLAAARIGKQWGYVNTKGEWAIERQYAMAYSFEKGKAKVIRESDDGSTWYHLVIDKNNQIIENDLTGKRKPDWFDSIDSWRTLIASGDIYLRLTDYQTAYAYFKAAGRRMETIEKEDTLGYITLCKNIAYMAAMRVEPEVFEKYDGLARAKFEEVVASNQPRRRLIILEYISYLIDLAAIRETNLQKAQEKETLERIVDAVKRSGTEDLKLYWDITDRLEEME